MGLTPQGFAALFEQKVDSFTFTDQDTGDRYEIEAVVTHKPGDAANRGADFEIQSVRKDGAGVEFKTLPPKLQHDIEFHIKTETGDRFYDPPEYFPPRG